MTATREKYFQLIWLLGYMIILELQENKLLNYVMKNKIKVLWHTLT